MLVRPHLPGYRWFHVFRNAAIRTGVYGGVCLTLVFAAWLVIANRAPFLDRFAMERNIAAAAILCFLAAVPVFRFLRRAPQRRRPRSGSASRRSSLHGNIAHPGTSQPIHSLRSIR